MNARSLNFFFFAMAFDIAKSIDAFDVITK
jgi:hypothetical protein